MQFMLGSLPEPIEATSVPPPPPQTSIPPEVDSELAFSMKFLKRKYRKVTPDVHSSPNILTKTQN